MSLWPKLGRILFWISWPASWLYLRRSHRTRVLMVADDTILLVQSWYGDGRWSLPGGGLHAGEPSSQGAIREVYEETGVTLAEPELRPAGTHHYQSHGLRFSYDLFIVERVGVTSTRPQPIEILAVRWWPLDKLSQVPCSPEVSRALAIWHP